MTTTTFPVITAVFSALLILLQQILMLSVGMHRVSVRIGIGSQGDSVLFRKQRRHANLAENGVALIILVALIEWVYPAGHLALGFAVLFLLGRLSHAIGFSFESGAQADRTNLPSVLRAIGAVTTSLGGYRGRNCYSRFYAYR